MPSLKRAVALDPELPCARYELGKALIHADDIEGAVAQFRETVRLLPEYASAWGNLGAALGELKDFEGASSALGRAVALDPENAPLHSNLGVACRDQGRLREAEEHFRRALESILASSSGTTISLMRFSSRSVTTKPSRTFEKAQSLDRGRSPRQALLLACARLASGDVARRAPRLPRGVRSALGGLPKRASRGRRMGLEGARSATGNDAGARGNGRVFAHDLTRSRGRAG